MKYINFKKIIRACTVISIMSLVLIILISLSKSLIVDPLIYWFASTSIARLVVACFISLFLLTRLFDFFYKYWIYKKRKAKFNALKIPYPRKFVGRKIKNN